MFANVAHHQHIHYFPHAPRYVDQSDFIDPRSRTAGEIVTQDNPSYGPQSRDFHPRSQRPQQYGQPLYKSRFNLRQREQASAPGPNGDVSEHMLRRKTPTGTLAAGYDGRPVEWADRPHATKHFLMPTSTAVGETAYQSLPRIEPASYPRQTRSRELYSTSQEHGHPFNGTTAENLENKDVVPSGDLRSTLPQPVGLDSVLNQGSWSYPYGSLACEQRNPTVLQPMWPPSLGFTAFNDPEQYGPRWAGDEYGPHRLASFQAPHYCPQPTDFGSNHQQNAFGSLSQQEFSPEEANPRGNLAQESFSGGIERDFALDQDENQNSTFSFQHGHSTPQHYHYSLAHRAKPRFTKPSSDNYISYRDHSAAFRAPSHSVSQRAPASNSGIHADQAQFKEKVLIWAHRVYGSLVAFTQQSRRNLRNSHNHGDRRLASCIYLKPPRISSFGSAKEHGFIGHDYEIHQRRSEYIREIRDHTIYPQPQWQSGAPVYNNASGDFAISAQGSIGNHPRQGLDFRHQRQVNNGQDSSLEMAPSDPNQTLPASVSALLFLQHETSPVSAAAAALDIIDRLCQESGWEWTEGMLLGGCLAYGLSEYDKAMNWYLRVLSNDSNNVEAMSNLAATFLCLNRTEEAERYWLCCVKLQPSFFEASEHLIGLLGEDDRKNEAVEVIDYIEKALWNDQDTDAFIASEINVGLAGGDKSSPKTSMHERSDYQPPDRHFADEKSASNKRLASIVFGQSGYAILPSDTGRLVALIHAKGNMLYQLGDNLGAARAFEDAILLGAGKQKFRIRSLIEHILQVFSDHSVVGRTQCGASIITKEPILLLPEVALETSQLVFPPQGNLPGLREVANGMAKRAAIAIVSNSLLSLAKIYQDGLSSNGASVNGPKAAPGVQEILALYYLSLSLQPSPSTANNVGILLASVQQTATSQIKFSSNKSQTPLIPGVVPGSGIALALAYYNYGLNLDSRHAHLYTNLGSLFKDIGQLNAAIKMYEKAVDCDGNFDIALANLANAVKDQGRISDAITYYRRAVSSNPEFSEAVCGLANALNSVCSWSGRGGVTQVGGKHDRWHVDDEGMLYDSRTSRYRGSGWIGKVVSIVEKQLHDGESWGKGILQSIDLEHLLKQLDFTYGAGEPDGHNLASMRRSLESWIGRPWEGAKVVRLVERATKRLGWQWYWNKYICRRPYSTIDRTRPQLPAALAIPSAPTVLPFHTFTCPLSAKQIRSISQRNGLRISCSTLRAPWLPARIYEPPAPPNPHFNVGYVSSDFNNHPLAHLMQSVFGFHDRGRVKAFCYATTASDGSVHRLQIEQEAPVFYDASSWSVDRLVNQIVDDGIHILVNLNGYTRGARNEVFAARPAPIQMSFMGFAGTLGAEWCDYLLADEISVPPQTLRPWRRNVDLLDQTMDENNEDDAGNWVYGENIIFTRDTFFCCDHRQSAPDSQGVQLDWVGEQERRWAMRHELFPKLADDVIILANFNQLYKIEPTTFRTWLRILSRIPNAVLWLLKFPDLGESNLRKTALLWVGSEVASRIIFTDVAPKHQHISRARICDLFLDTPECNAHTTAADVLWSGTPLLTLPRYEYKMCSRMAASILRGALPKTVEGERAMQDLVVRSEEEYEEQAVKLGLDLVYPMQEGAQGRGTGRLVELRKLLYESRWESALFDTRRWVHDLEIAYGKAWRRWVAGEGGDIWL